MPSGPTFPPGYELRPGCLRRHRPGRNTYVFRRVEPPVLVFSKNGDFLRAFGADLFTNLTASASTRRQRLGGGRRFPCRDQNEPNGPGADGPRPAGFRRQGPRPLRRAQRYRLRSRRELYVADGNNARIVKFSKQGRFLKAWGRPGSAKAINLPHGIAVDKQGLVYVCDRENLRVQIFDADGNFLRQWKDLERPLESILPRINRFTSATPGDTDS